MRLTQQLRDNLSSLASFSCQFANMKEIMTGSAEHPGEEMNGNRRPTQPLNKRTVYHSWAGKKEDRYDVLWTLKLLECT